MSWCVLNFFTRKYTGHTVKSFKMAMKRSCNKKQTNIPRNKGAKFNVYSEMVN